MSTLKILFKQEMSLSENNTIDTNTDDITGSCRLCLIKDTEMESLYKPLDEIFEDHVTTLFNLMEKLSSTKLSEDPKYPSYLCLTCVSLLNTAYKVNRLLEISQNQLSEFFKEDVEINKNETDCDLDQVEIISDKGKYDLKDVLIIEENDNQDGHFEGFLNNLGSVTSAEFITKDNQTKKNDEDEIHTINIIPLPGSEELNIADIVIEEEVETEKDEQETEKDQQEIENPIVENKSNLKCNQCDKIFKLKGNLFRHKKIVHGGKKSYLCQTCGYVTNVRTSLTNHMLLKHQGKRFACELCGKKYLSNSHLQYHMLMHKNERLYLCTVCGKNFNYGSSLEYHMRIHTGEKKYKCTYCDRAFSMRCGLNRHLRTHTGLRPYKCSYCEKAFRSKGEVNCHEMTHTGFRPYHCKLCGKGFTKTHNLKVHMLGHAGPVLCELCRKGFLDNDYLKLHMKLGHGLHDYDVSNSQILVVGDEADLEELNETLIITTE